MDQAPQHPDPTQPLSRDAYYQLIHILGALLPPPPANTIESLRARNDDAIAKVVALAPANADEVDIAAHCVLARAQVEEVRRLIRCHADDIELVTQLNAQLAVMQRTAIAIRDQLLRVQTARHKHARTAPPATWTPETSISPGG